MPCQQSRTKPQMPTPAASPGPKQPRRRNNANCVQATHKNQTSLEAETAWVHVCLGQPRAPNDLSLDADTCNLECWAETAPTPKQRKLRPGDKKPNQPQSRNGLGSCLTPETTLAEAASTPTQPRNSLVSRILLACRRTTFLLNGGAQRAPPTRWPTCRPGMRTGGGARSGAMHACARGGALRAASACGGSYGASALPGGSGCAMGRRSSSRKRRGHSSFSPKC